jgi:hypothetical protein
MSAAVVRQGGWQSGQAAGTARVLVALAWVLVPAFAFVLGAAELLAFFGETPTPEEERAAATAWTAGAAAAGLLPLVGLALAATGRQRTRWAVAAGVGVVVACVLLTWVDGLRPAPPEPPRPPVGCVERSGGEATCPGG